MHYFNLAVPVVECNKINSSILKLKDDLQKELNKTKAILTILLLKTNCSKAQRWSGQIVPLTLQLTADELRDWCLWQVMDTT